MQTVTEVTKGIPPRSLQQFKRSQLPTCLMDGGQFCRWRQLWPPQQIYLLRHLQQDTEVTVGFRNKTRVKGPNSYDVTSRLDETPLCAWGGHDNQTACHRRADRSGSTGRRSFSEIGMTICTVRPSVLQACSWSCQLLARRRWRNITSASSIATPIPPIIHSAEPDEARRARRRRSPDAVCEVWSAWRAKAGLL